MRVFENYEPQKLPKGLATDTGKRGSGGAETIMSVKHKYHFDAIYIFVNNLLSA